MAQSKLWSPPRKKPLHDFTPVYTAKHTTLVRIGNLKPPVKMSSNLPNLRRLFVEARSDAEESAYSRNAFYNLVLFMSSVALFSLAAQKMHNQK